MINILDLSQGEIEELVLSFGEKKFRGTQIFQWLYKGITSFEEMNNVPLNLLNKLGEIYEIGLPEIIKFQESKLDGTRKYLLELKDSHGVEAVLMRYKYGNSLCISSQVGCRMGCKFCASTIGGLVRNMTQGELIGQVLAIQKHIGERIGHIVIMGTGEPFDNYENLSKFLKTINNPKGMNLSMRNITVSTCGIVPMIDKFGDDFSQVNLAISLHQVDDINRSKLMPVNNKYPIGMLIEAAKRYTKKTSRRITFEYTLVLGENDSVEHAHKLAKLLNGILCHVNLIPLNVLKERDFMATEKRQAKAFMECLNNKGIPATIRRELGDDIDGACGQLRLKLNSSELSDKQAD